MEQIDILQGEVSNLRARLHDISNTVNTLTLQGHLCIKEQDWGKLFEALKTITLHVSEGDKVGGFRDRLLESEIALKEIKIQTEISLKNISNTIKEKFWQSSLIGGIIGVLIGSGCKEAINMLITWVMKK